jgi:ribonuclease I
MHPAAYVEAMRALTQEEVEELATTYVGQKLSPSDVARIFDQTVEDVMEAIYAGDLDARCSGSHWLILEDDLPAYRARLREKLHQDGEKARATARIRREFEYWQRSDSTRQYELHACPHCGIPIMARLPGPQDLDDLEFWEGDAWGTCSYCETESYFRSPRRQEPAPAADFSTMPF